MLLPMHMKMEAVQYSADWDWLHGRDDVPSAVAQLRAAGQPIILDPETTHEVQSWIDRVGWRADAAPVRLVPLES
jgi:hypothetical protein